MENKLIFRARGQSLIYGSAVGFGVVAFGLYALFFLRALASEGLGQFLASKASDELARTDGKNVSGAP